MEKKDIEYYEKLIDLTAHPEWETLVEEIKKEIWGIQGNVLESASSWEQVKWTQGYVAALAAMSNLRDTAKQILENSNEL